MDELTKLKLVNEQNFNRDRKQIGKRKTKIMELARKDRTNEKLPNRQNTNDHPANSHKIPDTNVPQTDPAYDPNKKVETEWKIQIDCQSISFILDEKH